MILIERIYKDYLRFSQLNRYERFLQNLKKAGYQSASLMDVYNARAELANKKIVVLRHDIDSDSRTAYKMYLIEKKNGFTGTYFFRQNTLDFSFARELIENGYEVGYHFEELATYGKKTGIKNKSEVIQIIPFVRDLFLKNFFQFKEQLDLLTMGIAAHGDFFNRQLGVLNNYFIDEAFKVKNGITYEAYDKKLLDFFDLYQSDASCIHSYPERQLEDIFKAQRICLLIHPRQWKASFFVNLSLDLYRIIDQLMWNFRKWKKRV